MTVTFSGSTVPNPHGHIEVELPWSQHLAASTLEGYHRCLDDAAKMLGALKLGATCTQETVVGQRELTRYGLWSVELKSVVAATVDRKQSDRISVKILGATPVDLLNDVHSSKTIKFVGHVSCLLIN